MTVVEVWIGELSVVRVSSWGVRSRGVRSCGVIVEMWVGDVSVVGVSVGDVSVIKMLVAEVSAVKVSVVIMHQ